jgi:aldehyde:ferredoxin oxidoreductase
MSGTLGLAFHLYEQGVLTEAETGGLSLRWGDADLVARLIDLTVQREGFGAWLAEGSLALARRLGVEEEAVQVRGLEVPYHDPRGASGMALVYATSPRGACHNQSDYFLADIGQVEERLGLQFYDRHAGAEKAANVARHQDWRTLQNALVMCFFANVPPDDVAALVSAALGEPYTVEDLLTVGERAWHLKRLLNLRLGLKPEDDRLPAPLLEPLPDGGAAGYRIPFGEMLAAYRTARGWDPMTGAPSPEVCRRLGLPAA